VTSEFGTRDALANDRACDLIVRVQLLRYDDNAGFAAQATNTRNPNVVIFLIGSRRTGFPTRSKPSGFGDSRGVTGHLHPVGDVLRRHFGEMPHLATDEFKRDKHRPPDARTCSQLIAHVKAPGPQWTPVGSLMNSGGGFKDCCAARYHQGFGPDIGKLAPKPIDLTIPPSAPVQGRRPSWTTCTPASPPDGGTAAIAGIAVHGMGGVGQTSRRGYAWAHRDDIPPCSSGRRDPGQTAPALAALAAA
jgi:hypothetical protein